ncbi:hypothetical protein D3C73_1628600 [compost metagenome]
MPGEDGNARVIDVSGVKSVYDLLELVRQEEAKPPQEQPAATHIPKRQAVLLPFIARTADERRHPSA